MRPVESFFFHNLVVKLASVARGLDCINIKPGANAAISHSRDKRLLIDNLTSRSIDEISALAHRVEEVRAKKVSSFGIQCQVNTDNVGSGSNSFRRFF